MLPGNEVIHWGIPDSKTGNNYRQTSASIFDGNIAAQFKACQVLFIPNNRVRIKV